MTLRATARSFHPKGVLPLQPVEHFLQGNVRSRIIQGLLNLAAQQLVESLLLPIESAKTRPDDLTCGAVRSRFYSSVHALLKFAESYRDGLVVRITDS